MIQVKVSVSEQVYLQLQRARIIATKVANNGRTATIGESIDMVMSMVPLDEIERRVDESMGISAERN